MRTGNGHSPSLLLRLNRLEAEVREDRQNDQALLDSALATALEADADDVFVVDIEGFEGPLHLLLALAKRQKVDLAYVSVLGLAEQYLEFVSRAQLKRLDLAAEYLLMASWLAFLKSRLLMPRASPASSEKETEDGDADQLRLRLIRLEAFKRAGKALLGADQLNRDVFLRGEAQSPVVIKSPVYSETLRDLMAAFAEYQNRQALKQPHAVKRLPVMSLETARTSLKARLGQQRDWRSLEALLPQRAEQYAGIPRRSVHASYFSAALELTRDGAVEMRQDGLFQTIFVRGRNKRSVEARHD